MAKTVKNTIRVKFTDSLGNVSYLVKETDGKVRYISSSETPLAFSNMFPHDAAAVRFAVEDARDAITVMRVLRTHPSVARKVELI